MQRDDAILLDILRAARLAVVFKGDTDKPAFLNDLKTQSAVLHQLLVLGEAVKRLSEGFRTGYPAVPWRMIAGMRDKLIHAYDAVDLDEVWKTVSIDIPSLITLLEPLEPLLPCDPCSPPAQGALCRATCRSSGLLRRTWGA